MKKSSLINLLEILIIITSILGLYLNFHLFQDKIGILYYTILSNLYIFIFYLVIIILKLFNCFKKNKLYYLFKGLTYISMLYTLITFNLIMPFIETPIVYQNHPLESYLVHLITPLLVVLSNLIEKKKTLKYQYTIFWLIPFILYGIMIIIYIENGGLFLEGAKTPYPFIDTQKYGNITCIISCIAIIIIYILLELLIVYHNNKERRRQK